MPITRRSVSRSVAVFCLLSVGASVGLLIGCSSGSGGDNFNALIASGQVESCMTCHNGASHNDYSGSGMENPHPFGGAGTLKCTDCHGGDPFGLTQLAAHTPPPPEIGDRAFQDNNNLAYFNRLTLVGIDKYADYQVDGTTYSAIDYLQFINPGDLRVITQGRACGLCHTGHTETVSRSVLSTETGIFSGAMFSIGAENQVPTNQNLFQDTASDLSFRAITDPAFVFDANNIGAIGELVEFPVFSRRNGTDPLDIFNNVAVYSSPLLVNDLALDNSVIPNSPLANLYHEQVAFTCGDCHLGSAGANNRYGDFRSSGCTACHMRYSLDGRSRISDPRVNKIEPLNVDQINDPERPHVKRHMIASVAQTLQSGETIQGIDDYTCAGCHQGSNRTVMQYWGIRLDQNQDVRQRNQYPTDPVSYTTTRFDTRLFDPVVQNQTFNGRNFNQYLLEEDYDGDGRDDTPPDIHYEAGMGCIDCHGSHELHGGAIDANPDNLLSRMDQVVSITCESCHGSIAAYATTAAGVDYAGQPATLAVDRKGNTLRNVVEESPGTFYLTSRLTGNRHYIKQTRDTVNDSGKLHPTTNQPIYSAKASYAMGRIDADNTNGMGPIQQGGNTNLFSHTDNMSCTSCHASWTNNCIGCHLEGEYDNNFSNITGERIIFEERNADFVYQSPVPFQLGVDSKNKISPIASNTTTFFKYRDQDNVWSSVFAFSDRNGKGNNPGAGTFGALSHNAMAPHSIRGKVSSTNEGPRYCVACHLTDDAIANYGTAYNDFISRMDTNDFANLNWAQLQQHIGANPGNQLNSPFFVHMVSGLGSGLFLMDQYGCPVNPIDDDDDRKGCNFNDFDNNNGFAPNAIYDPANVVYNLDRIVEKDGVSNSSNTHPMLNPGVGPQLRDGADDPNMAGPLGSSLIETLADPLNGIILDSWIDANGDLGGQAGVVVP